MMMELSRRVYCQVRLCGIILAALSVDVTAAAADDCAGGIAGSVIGTFLVTLILCGLGYFGFRYYQKKKGKNRPLTLDSPDSEAGGRYVYDNPHFQEEEPEPANHRRTAATSLDAVERGEIGLDATKNNSTLENRNQGNAKLKKGKNAKSNLLSGLKNGKAHKQRALDDSCINLGPEKIVVPLRGIDFTGLGFNICGNMRDGIFIKDVLHRGPAMESGKIKAGDRILSVTVSFTNMVYEDALTILSYASPYDVQLEIQKLADSGRLPGHQKKGSNASNTSGIGSGYGSAADQLYHPLYRSQSIGDLSKIGRDETGAKRSLSIGGPAVKLGTKKEALVKTSHSLREEGTVDLDTERLSLGATQVTSSPDIGPSGKVSRFRVQKVAEVEDVAADKKTLPVSAQPELAGSSAKRKTSSSSSDNEFSAAQGAAKEDDRYFKPLQTTNRYLVGEGEVRFPVEDCGPNVVDTAEGSDRSFAEIATVDLISLELSDGQGAAPVPTRRISVPGKRKAPLPPAASSSGLPDDYWTDTVQENVTVVSTNRHHVTTLKVSPDIHQAPDWVPSAVASQTHFSSESDTSLSDEGDGGAAVGPRRKKSKDRRRRASSLGDLNHVEDTASPPKTFPFERSVSMDLTHAIHTHVRNRPTMVGGDDLGVVDPGEDLLVGPVAGTLTKHFTARENLHLDNGDQHSWDTLSEDRGLLTDGAKVNGPEQSAAVVNSDDTSSDDDGDSAPAPRAAIKEDDAMSDVSLSDHETSGSGDHSKPIIRKMIAVDLSADDHYCSYSSSSSDQEEPSEALDSLSSSYIHHDAVTGSSLVTIEAVTSNATAHMPTSTVSVDPELTKIFNNVIVSNSSKDPIGSDAIQGLDAKNGSDGADYSDDLLVRLEDSPLPPPNGNGSVSPPIDRQYESRLQQDDRDHRKFGVISFESTSPHGNTLLQKVTTADPSITNYTVSEGALAHAVIISNPQLTITTTTTTSDHILDRPPALQPPE